MYYSHQTACSAAMGSIRQFWKVGLRTADGFSLEIMVRGFRETKDGRLFPTFLYLHGKTGIGGIGAKLISLGDAGFGHHAGRIPRVDGNPGKTTESGLILDADAAFISSAKSRETTPRSIYYCCPWAPALPRDWPSRGRLPPFYSGSGAPPFILTPGVVVWFLPLPSCEGYLSVRERYGVLEKPLC